MDIRKAALVAARVGDGDDLPGAGEAEPPCADGFPGGGDVHHVAARGLVVKEASSELGLDPFYVGPECNFIDLGVGEECNCRASVKARRGVADRRAERFEAGAKVGGPAFAGQQRLHVHPPRRVGRALGEQSARRRRGSGADADRLVFPLPLADPMNTLVGCYGFHFRSGGPDDIGVFGDVAADLGRGFQPQAPFFGDAAPELHDVGRTRRNIDGL